MSKLPREQEQIPNQPPVVSYEEILASSLSEDVSARTETLAFLENCPSLPQDPREAFLVIRDYFFEKGIRYDDTVFMPEDIVRLKKANCLGLTVLFGAIFEARGLSPKFEVVVNAHDKRHEREAKDFLKLLHGDVFPYDDLPELPVEKLEDPEYHFVPLEHPVVIIGEQKFETTSLKDDDEEKWIDDEIHNFESESQRSVTLKNLTGSLLVSRAKLLYHEFKKGADLDPIISLAKMGLTLWPDDRQGWLFLRDLAIEKDDKGLVDEAETNFKKLATDDSLYLFSLYEITGDKGYLKESLAKYPAFIDAFVLDKVHLPITTPEERLEAQFNLTVAAICVANSVELDLRSFYMRHFELFVEAFGSDVMAEVLDEINAIESESDDS